MRRARLDSGAMGWRARLRDNYASADEWRSYSDTYGLAERLGYPDADTAWTENPMVQGGTDPRDFRKAGPHA